MYMRPQKTLLHSNLNLKIPDSLSTDLKKAVALHFSQLGSETGIHSLQSATSRRVRVTISIINR